LSIKSEDGFELNLLSIEEMKVKFLAKKAKEEERANELRIQKQFFDIQQSKRLEDAKAEKALLELNQKKKLEERRLHEYNMLQRSIAQQKLLDQEAEDRKIQLQSGTASYSDFKIDISEFLDEAPCIRDQCSNNNFKGKLKYIYRYKLNELEQEQLIINHSLFEECKKHNIDAHLIKLIPINDQDTFSTSTVYDNIKDFSTLPKTVVKKHKKWLEHKKDKMNKLKSNFTSLFGHLLGMDDEYKEVEEKILTPARVKLAKAESSTNILSTSVYIKKLTLLIEQHELDFNHWSIEVRPRLLEKLNCLRKDFVLALLEAFEIPTGS
jgi:hypothetical protein